MHDLKYYKNQLYKCIFLHLMRLSGLKGTHNTSNTESEHNSAVHFDQKGNYCYMQLYLLVSNATLLTVTAGNFLENIFWDIIFAFIR